MWRRFSPLLGGVVVAVVATGAVAAPGHGAPGDPVAAGVPALSGEPRAASAAGPGRAVTVTLITGDRVTVRDGKAVGIQRGPGRDGVRFVTRSDRNHLYVIPGDASDLVRAGRIDRRLFDVSALIRFGYDDRRRGDLPLIVTSAPGERAASGARAAVAAGGARVVREVPALGARAVRADKKAATGVWAGLTTGGVSARSLHAGVQKV